MNAPDQLSGGLADIPSFDDIVHEGQVDREQDARARDGIRELGYGSVDVAWGNYQKAREAADRARRVPAETETPAPQAQSSVQIEDAAKGDPRVTTKLYAGSPLTDAMLDAALEAHGYVHRMAAEMAVQGWQQTVDQLKARSV